MMKRRINMAFKECKKCTKGIIMKQIALGEYIPEPCICLIKEEENRYDKWFNNIRANP